MCHYSAIVLQELSIAEMGDRLATTKAEKWGAAVPLSVGGAGTPSNAM